ncbi:ribosome hibernation-promoting factor, HPF/YfiA family [Calothrix sp. PCC 6303]|uniref:ribosome hibernation-promoting factor, HPF/YfiA family n=1 Tax=Calothrix sp. PCC 6303 TaxID=1170562 RepID=UPI0002A040F2|nr:ribosome-associated translation inhibitor RaiA [Calothrix sp. PCC 6303]AFY99263.1 ribosomal subunit interface protein [Calothrix sp. PCC 6303]
MKDKLQITFHNVDASPAVEEKISENVNKLERFYDHIISCRVTVDNPHRHQRKGNLYHVRIDITVPNGELVVNRNPLDEPNHSDVYVAIRDAFEAARRQLQDYVGLQRDEARKTVVVMPKI